LNKLEHITPYDYRLLDTPPARTATRGWINEQKDKIKVLVDRMVEFEKYERHYLTNDKGAKSLWILDRDAIYQYVLKVTDERKLTRTDKKNANDMWKRYMI